ncbi:MAG: hypothetical protein E7Z86_05330 [Methanosphaera stadtmanae]|nr:hypothetical protein [Methanosphaera stadtmanae]
MVKLEFKRKVMRENDDEDKPMYVEVPREIVEMYQLNDGDEIEWTFEINCKNQKVTTFHYQYKGF